MKKLKKLKLSEMQDFTAIEKQESMSLKGGWTVNAEGWTQLLIEKGYRTFNLAMGSVAGSIVNGVRYSGDISMEYGVRFIWGDDNTGTNARNSNQLWTYGPSNGWTSETFGSDTYNRVLAKGYILSGSGSY